MIVEGCACPVCVLARRLERDGTEYTAPPWTCGDCGCTTNLGSRCDYCGQLWEFA